MCQFVSLSRCNVFHKGFEEKDDAMMMMMMMALMMMMLFKIYNLHTPPTLVLSLVRPRWSIDHTNLTLQNVFRLNLPHPGREFGPPYIFIPKSVPSPKKIGNHWCIPMF